VLDVSGPAGFGGQLSVGEDVSESPACWGVSVSTVSRSWVGTTLPGILSITAPVDLAGRARRALSCWGSGPIGAKRADAAQRTAGDSGNLVGHRLLRSLVLAKLRRRWFPRQIARCLSPCSRTGRSCGVPRNDLPGAVCACAGQPARGVDLPGRACAPAGRPQAAVRAGHRGEPGPRKPWIGGLHISTRPSSHDRAVPGHWEGISIGARTPSRS